MNLSKEELEKRYKEIEHVLPLNEHITEPIPTYFDPYTQQEEIAEEYQKNQKDLIRQLKVQVEVLTKIVNVIAPLAMKHNPRKFPGT